MDLRPQTQSQGASNNTNRPGSSVANEAFDNHERLVVPYHLNGSKQAATLIVCGAVIDQAGSPTPVAIVWLVDPLRDSNQPIDLSSHPYFVRALAQSLKDNAELTLISPSEVKDSMNVNDVHPELNNLESTLIVQSAEGKVVHGIVSQMLRDLDTALDPLLIEVTAPESSPQTPKLSPVSKLTTPIEDNPTILPFVRMSPMKITNSTSHSTLAGRIVSECIGLGIVKDTDVPGWQKLTERLIKELDTNEALTASHLAHVVFNSIKGSPLQAQAFDQHHSPLTTHIHSILEAKRKSEFDFAEATLQEKLAAGS